jgi:predicted porin
MKKTLVALAALASVSAFAQSSVTMYGILDVGMNQATAQSSSATIKATQTGGNAAGGWASNRLGFKGTEDIGGGTKANFVYELGMAAGTTGKLAESATTADAVGEARQSWASLGNDKLGEVAIGRNYTPIFSTSAALDAGGANNIAFGRVIYGKVATTRNSKQVMYTSPSMSGLTAKLAYGTTTTNTDGTLASTDYATNGGSLVFANGPVTVHAAYNLNKILAKGDNTKTSDKMETMFGGTYMVGKATLLAVYGKNKEISQNGDQTKSRKGYQLGVKYPLTSTVDSFLTYGRATVQAAATAAEGTAKGTQVGAIYNLSKRTGVYAAYGKTTGDTSATASAATNPATPDSTVKGTELAVGVRHSF